MMPLPLGHAALCVALRLASGCKKKEDACAVTGPPASGRCQALRVKDGIVIDQFCPWEGFWWRCTGERGTDCTRGDRLPEEKAP